MSILRARSPYIVYHNDTNLNSFSLNLFIYTGAKTTDRPATPNYTLETTALNSEAYIDISRFVLDYIETKFTGEYLCEAVHVDYAVTKVINLVIQPEEAYVQLDGVDGFVYGDEDQLPVLDSALMIRGRYIEKPFGQGLVIPINRSEAVNVAYYKDNQQVYLENITSSDESTDIITYIRDAQNHETNFEERVLQQGGSLIGECINFACLFDFYGADRIVVEGANYSEEIIIAERLPSFQDVKKVTFINSLGAKEDLYFFGEMQVSQKVKSDKYKSNVLLNGVKDTKRHQHRKINSNGRGSFVLSSGYVSEKTNDSFRDLINSELVWLTIDNKILPIEIEDSTFEFKNHRRNGLIDYEIRGKFAFDAINNIK